MVLVCCVVVAPAFAHGQKVVILSTDSRVATTDIVKQDWHGLVWGRASPKIGCLDHTNRTSTGSRRSQLEMAVPLGVDKVGEECL